MRPVRLASAVATLFGLGLACSLSIAIAWTARRYVTRSPRFAVVDIEVTGEHRRSAAAIIAESGLAMGSNIFSSDLDAARKRVLGDGWIAEASIGRRLPGTLVVRVSERRPAALVALGDLFIASDDGLLFKPLSLDDGTLDLPIVTGLEAREVREDPAGAAQTIRRAIALAAELSASALSRRLPLQEVHVAENGTFTLVVGGADTELVMGGPPFRGKLQEATRVISELDRRGAKAAALLLDNNARPDRVVVRMR